MRVLILLFTLLLLFIPEHVFASAAIEARQRAAQVQQQQAIRQHQQQVIQAQQQAYKQAVIQRQQQAVNQAVSSRVAQQQAYNQAVQQKIQQVVQENQIAAMSAQQQIAYRLQAQQQAQQQAYQQAMAQTGVLMSNQYNQMPMGSPQISMPNIQAPAYGDLFYTPPVAEVVNITDIWQKMEENSHAWTIMIDMEPKVLTVQRMIDHFRDQGISVQKGPSHYVQLIDSMAFQNPQMLDQPFENIMKVIAIIEYDFDNGQDKDALARQIFPDDRQFQDNKKRLGF